MAQVGNLARPLILCIDDDADGLLLRKEILERQGYSVIAVTGASEGLTAFLTKDVALVIADSLLRGVSGISLASQMKRAKPTVPIVMLSGAAPEHIGHVDCYIHKG